MLRVIFTPGAGVTLGVTDRNETEHFPSPLPHCLHARSPFLPLRVRALLVVACYPPLPPSSPASTLYIYIIAIDTVMIGVIMHADGAVNGCVDTVLTGCRGHISPTVSGGSSGYAQPSFRFDYSDARLMGVTSLPLHNLGREDGQ